MNTKKTIIIITVVIAALYFGLQQKTQVQRQSPVQVSQDSGAILQNAFETRTSNLQVNGQGVVIKILPDDRKGSRHQKFLVKLKSGQTLLISHNIDLAPRINKLQTGDNISFYGEYEWNPKGGLIHWTHHDPAGRHITGWIKHNGSTYQ